MVATVAGLSLTYTLVAFVGSYFAGILSVVSSIFGSVKTFVDWFQSNLMLLGV